MEAFSGRVRRSRIARRAGESACPRRQFGMLIRAAIETTENEQRAGAENGAGETGVSSILGPVIRVPVPL